MKTVRDCRSNIDLSGRYGLRIAATRSDLDDTRATASSLYPPAYVPPKTITARVLINKLCESARGLQRRNQNYLRRQCCPERKARPRYPHAGSDQIRSISGSKQGLFGTAIELVERHASRDGHIQREERETVHEPVGSSAFSSARQIASPIGNYGRARRRRRRLRRRRDHRPARKATKRAIAGPASKTSRNRAICIAMMNDMSTWVEAAMMATESAPPGLVAR